MEHTRDLDSVSDDELLRRLAALLQQSRRVEADLVAHIAEVDARRLYAREAAPSMFVYCTQVLRLSEAEATCASRRPALLGSTPCSSRCWPTVACTSAPSRSSPRT
jgi:hypothetical protein